MGQGNASAELKVIGKERRHLCPRSIPKDNSLHTEGWARDREASAASATSHQSELLAVQNGIQLASVTAGMAYPTYLAKPGSVLNWLPWTEAPRTAWAAPAAARTVYGPPYLPS